MRRNHRFLTILALVAAALPATAQVPAPQPLVIKNTTVIDGSGKVQQNVDITMSYMKIDEIGPNLKLDPLLKYKVVDGTGKYVIPGLIDARVQIASSPANRIMRSEMGEEQRVASLHSLVQFGITTTRLIQGDLTEHLDFKHWRDLEQLNSPYFVLSGPTFTAVGGYPASDYGLAAIETREREVYEIKDEDSGRQKARKVAHGGGQIFEIFYSDPSGLPRLPDNLMALLVKEAHDHELRAFCWVGHNSEALTAIADGCDVIEGLTEDKFSDDVLKQMKEKKVAFLPSLVYQGYAVTQFSDPDRLQQFLSRPQVDASLSPLLKKSFAAKHGPVVFMRAFMNLRTNVTPTQMAAAAAHPERFLTPVSEPADGPHFPTFRESYEQEEARAQDNVKRAHADGVPILVGTGAGSILDLPGASEHLELKLLVDSGLTALDAIDAATAGTAAALGIGDKTGTLAKGKFADLLLLDADPLADIQNTTKINTVVRHGRIVDHENAFEY
jgi:hypothetical protein